MKTFKLSLARTVLMTAAVMFLFSCSEDEKTLSVNFKYEEALDRVYLWDTSDIVGDGKMSIEWTSDKDLDIRRASDDSYYFVLPSTDVGGSAQVTLKVTSGKSTGTVTKTVPAPRHADHRRYGLGYVCSEELSNDVSYPWYVDQENTGTYARINCGPAATEMAGRWARQDFPMTAEQLRDHSQRTDNWTTTNISNYLRDNGVTRRNISFTSFDGLKAELDDGNIAILCLDIYYVRTESVANSSEWRKDKFYTTSSVGTGHFVVVKGYKEVDGEYLLECYDPWSIGLTYDNGVYKGRDRYYRLSDILKAADVWWKYAIVVSPVSPVRSAGAYMEWDGEGLDPDTVPEQWG